MKAETFDKIVEARANERVQEKVAKFKMECLFALEHLLGGKKWSGYNIDTTYLNNMRLPFSLLASENHRSGWPKILWETERNAVREELLGIMDEMQKALLAADKNQPGENREADE